MGETKTLTGGCHCGAVRFTVDLELKSVMSCNCSLCGKRGGLLAFAPAEKLQLLSGEDALSDYQFNKKIIHHLFCKHCGISSFTRGVGPGGKPMCSVNVRCLDDVDVDSLPVTKYDGRNH